MKNNLFPKINFIGNKDNIAEWIVSNFPDDAKSVFDAFSGGGSVSYFAKRKGLKVISNDIMHVNYLLSKSLIQNNKIKLSDKDVKKIFLGHPINGFMSKNYANKYFYLNECSELDLYRENINKLSNIYKRAIAFTVLRRSMIRKMPYSRFNINWNKVQQLRDEDYSYRKYLRKRAYHNKSFKYHFLDNINDYNNAVFDNKQMNVALKSDVFEIINKIKSDIIYLDPPYSGTMNNYYGFYNLLDEYILSKKIKPFNNNFMSKKDSVDLFNQLFSKMSKFKYWILSYNNNAYPSKETLIDIISKYSHNIKVIEKKHIYKITGKRMKNKNTEYLFIVKNSKYHE
jgi:adenine-specific DNA-methyltransferase